MFAWKKKRLPFNFRPFIFIWLYLWTKCLCMRMLGNFKPQMKQQTNYTRRVHMEK